MAERLRGRAAVTQRRRRLQAEPLCRDCAAKGIITTAVVVDHIVPLALGGDDSDANTRNLCIPCHGTRTCEQFGFRRRIEVNADGWPCE